MKKLFLVLFLALLVFYTNAQPTKIRGIVFDTSTKQTIPYVNILLKNSSEGTISDKDGAFFIQTFSSNDTLIISCLGYKNQEIKLKKFCYNDLLINLEPIDFYINEITVKPGENPAWKIMRRIIDNKKYNNPEKLSGYSYEAYNKVEIDISNITPDLKYIFKDYDFIFANVDTSAETGKTYLPVIIYESISDLNFRKFPKQKKEVIKALKTSGIENKSITQYAGQMHFEINIYDNYIEIFDRQFISPFSDFWRLTYKYHLLDTISVDGKNQYLITFEPQRTQEMTFTGEFWVQDSVFAISKAKLRISDDVNINFINDFILQQEFGETDNFWFLTSDEIFVDFNISDQTYGIFGKKITSLKNIEIEPVFDKNTFTITIPEESIILDDAQNKDSAFWVEARHLKLENQEQNIYLMVDSVKKTKGYKIGEIIAYTWITGYFKHSWWEIGPLYTFYSRNLIEGRRIKFGGRTSNEFSKRIMFDAAAAYGFYDKKIKYSGGATFLLSKSHFRKLIIRYKSDLEQLGLSSYAFSEDNIVTTVFGRTSYNKLLPVKEFLIYYKHEWFEGFSNTLNIKHRTLFATQVIEFKNITENINFKNITTAEISLNFHFAYNEKFVKGEFERYSLGSEYPVLNFTLNKGIKNVLKSEYDYFQIVGNLEYKFNINPIGKFQIITEAGKLWGKVPFPLLKLHEGNETYIFDAYSFNMMNYYEFASDEYASLYLEHHFNGFFLNKIPLIKLLKFREIVYAKGLIGRISYENYENAIFDFPSTLSNVNKPYIELGVGLENILKVFRIDVIWRLSYLENPEISKFGIRFNMQFVL